MRRRCSTDHHGFDVAPSAAAPRYRGGMRDAQALRLIERSRSDSVSSRSRSTKLRSLRAEGRPAHVARELLRHVGAEQGGGLRPVREDGTKELVVWPLHAVAHRPGSVAAGAGAFVRRQPRLAAAVYARIAIEVRRAFVDGLRHKEPDGRPRRERWCGRHGRWRT